MQNVSFRAQRKLSTLKMLVITESVSSVQSLSRVRLFATP